MYVFVLANINYQRSNHHLVVVVVVGQHASGVVVDTAWPDDDMLPFRTAAVVHGDVQHS